MEEGIFRGLCKHSLTVTAHHKIQPLTSGSHRTRGLSCLTQNYSARSFADH